MMSLGSEIFATRSASRLCGLTSSETPGNSYRRHEKMELRTGHSIRDQRWRCRIGDKPGFGLRASAEDLYELSPINDLQRMPSAGHGWHDRRTVDLCLQRQLNRSGRSWRRIVVVLRVAHRDDRDGQGGDGDASDNPGEPVAVTEVTASAVLAHHEQALLFG